MASRPQSHPWRRVGFVVAVLAALYATMLSIGHLSPELGLDLRGGTSVILTPAAHKKVTNGALKQAVDIIRQRVNGLGVSGSSVVRQANNVVITVPGKGRNSVLGLVGQTAALDFRQVYASAAGVTPPKSSASPKASPSGSPSVSPSASSGASASPKASTSSKASASPSASASGAPSAGKVSPSASSSAHPAPLSGALEASPSPTPTATAARAAAATPTATPTRSAAAATTPAATPAATPTASTPAAAAGPTPPASAVLAYEKLQCTPNNIRPRSYVDDPSGWLASCDYTGSVKYLLEPAQIVGTAVSSAAATLQQGANGVVTNNWVVDLSFKGSAQSKVLAITTALQGTNKQLAIVLDGVTESAPVINQAFSANAQIQGSSTNPFTQKQASNLANVLKYGALPVSFTPSQALSVSATLGRSSLSAGLLAGAIGLGLVVLYCFLYYRALGIVTIVSLSMSGALIYALVSLAGPGLGETLNLSGIAGLIVSIGITADSFVVFYERLKDEVREGRSVRSSVEKGWVRARRTILSADTISFLAAVILYLVSIGDVRGFAFTLGLSTLLDVFVVFLFTKPLVTLLVARPFFSTSRFSGLAAGHAGIPRARSRSAGSGPPPGPAAPAPKEA